MLIKFKIVYEDGSFLESHDRMWNQVADHCHAVIPHNKKRWKEYHLICNDNGTHVSVNFQTGVFIINGQEIYPAMEGGGPLTNRPHPQTFKEANERWRFLNGLNYFPVVGRRKFKGDWGSLEVPFCGWKIRQEVDKKLKTIQKQIFIFPNGKVVLT